MFKMAAVMSYFIQKSAAICLAHMQQSYLLVKPAAPPVNTNAIRLQYNSGCAYHYGSFNPT